MPAKYLMAAMLLLALVISGCNLLTVQDEQDNVPPFVEPDACHYALIIRQDEQSSTGYYVYIQDVLEDVFSAELLINDQPVPLVNLGNALYTVYRGEVDVAPGVLYGGKVTLDNMAYDFAIRVVYPILDFSCDNNRELPTISWSLEGSNSYQLLDGYWGVAPDNGHFARELDPAKRSFTYPSHPYTELNLFNINMNTYQNYTLGVYSYSDVKYTFPMDKPN